MEIRPGYKQTEVGVIPADWEVRKIKSVCTLINGRGFKPFEWQKSGLPIIRIQNLNGSDEFNFYEGSYDKKLEIEPGQLLFAWSGSRGTSFGPHVWSGPLGLLNYHTWKVQVNETEIDKNFFLHALKNLTAFIEDKAHGASALVHTQKWEMEGFEFTTPTVKAEQRAIATALSDVDALLIKLDQLIAKKRDLKQATMQQLLTGQTRLPGFSGEWDKAQLKSFIRSHNSGIYKKSEKYGQGCNIIGVSDLYGINCVDGQSFSHVPLTASERAKHTLETGDLLYGESSLVREGIARTVYVTEKGAGTAFAWHTRRYNIDQSSLLSPFLYYYLQGQRARKHMMDQSIQTAITGINTTAYFECPILVPSLAEQTAIATILSDMDAEIAVLEARHDKTRALKQGMMHELLTGRIRLV